MDSPRMDLGGDLWTVTPTQITNYLAKFYILEVLYFAQVFLLKLSLLFFYLRISQPLDFESYFGERLSSTSCSALPFLLREYSNAVRSRTTGLNGMDYTLVNVSTSIDLVGPTQ
jgi:hypothetical protein